MTIVSSRVELFTPDMNNGKTIFVFGSNEAGRHGLGAALEAAKYWGAEYGVGEGRTGQSYAIPTKDRYLDVLRLTEIRLCIQRFMRYAKENDDLTYLVTRIGCGLAGYTETQIAPMFRTWESPVIPRHIILPTGW
jgi:hypothetical protein